jgi:hypothetical protein
MIYRAVDCRLIRMVSPILRFPPEKSIVLKRETLKCGKAISSAMQPFQLFSCSGSGIAAMAGAATQLWQLSSSSSLAITAQLHQQRSNLQQFQLRQPCSRVALQPCSLAAVQPCSPRQQPCSFTALRSCSPNEKPQNLRYQQRPYSQPPTKSHTSFQD